jgi:hypothetical protein
MLPASFLFSLLNSNLLADGVQEKFLKSLRPQERSGGAANPEAIPDARTLFLPIPSNCVRQQQN